MHKREPQVSCCCYVQIPTVGSPNGPGKYISMMNDGSRNTRDQRLGIELPVQKKRRPD